MAKTVTVNGPSIGFSGLLTVLFIGLKLTNVIAWSWWWVLSPLWLPWAVFTAFLLLVFLVALVAS